MASKKTNVPADLAEAFKKIRKQYGENAIFMGGEAPQNVEAIATGCYSIDRLLGCGGIPKGRIVEVFGQESSGKSTLCLFFIAQVQRSGGVCLYIDAENAYDAQYAKHVGVDESKLLVMQPTSLEEAMDSVREIVKTNAVDLIVVDSLAALVPKAFLEGEEMLKDSMAVQARLMSKALQILTGEIARSKTIVVFINQTRENMNIKWAGPRETTPGGKALKFYSSIRLQVTKGTRILAKDESQIGNTVYIKAVKNKVGFPFKEGQFDLYYGSGVDLEADALDTAVELKIISKSGNTYEYGERKLGVGRAVAIGVLREDRGLCTSLRGDIDNALARQDASA